MVSNLKTTRKNETGKKPIPVDGKKPEPETILKNITSKKQAKLNDALFEAIKNNNLTMVEQLMKSGANICAKYETGTYIYVIISKNISKEVHSNVMDLIKKTDEKKFYELVGAFANLTFKKMGLDSDLAHAVGEKDLVKVKQFISEGANVNTCKRQWIFDEHYTDTPILIYAVRCANVDIVKELIKAGADVITSSQRENGEERKYSALTVAIEEMKSAKKDKEEEKVQKYVEIIDVLITQFSIITEKSKPQFEQTTLNRNLFSAIKKEQVETTERLIEKGAQVNCRDGEGYSPLMRAVNCEFIDIVRLLLRNGADINVENGSEENALLISISKGNYEIFELLLTHNPNNLLVDKSKSSEIPLLTAAKCLSEGLDNSDPKTKNYLRMVEVLSKLMFS